MPTLNWLDLVLGFILLISILQGLHKGLSREVIGLAAALLGLLLAFQFYRLAGEPLRRYIEADALTSVAGFLIIFFGVLIAGAIASSVVRKILKAAGLSLIDRLLGAVYGLARGSLVAMAIIIAIHTFTSSEAVVHSRVAPYVIEASGLVAKVVPGGLESPIQREYEELKTPSGPQERKN